MRKPGTTFGRVTHTPGPWHVTGQSEGGRYITVKAEQGRTVARVPFNTEREVEAGQITDSADADLIAAAPDLLAALRRVMEAMDDGSDQPALVEARAAIALAMGEGQS